MSYDFSKFKKDMVETVEWLTKEYSSIRTGRATPTLLDGVTVDVYGTRTPLKHCTGITTEDARTLRVSPWDKSQIKDIEKAIIKSDLGVSVSVDDSGLRVSFPELTSERRVQLSRIAGDKLEDARISLRSEREKVWNDIQTQERNGEMSEDDKFAAKEELQKLMDEANGQLDALLKKKEAEISE